MLLSASTSAFSPLVRKVKNYIFVSIFKKKKKIGVSTRGASIVSRAFSLSLDNASKLGLILEYGNSHAYLCYSLGSHRCLGGGGRLSYTLPDLEGAPVIFVI
jgi:hypothetical protein